MSSHEVRTLRAANFRISSASPEDLTSIIPHVASSLVDCKTLLSGAPTTGKDAANSVLVQKVKTQITTLLNSKTAQGRWAGTVLVKTVIEVGGLETLSKSGVWVRSLLSNLNKHDPPSCKRLAIITLTRIFDLTHGHQTIIREMTTPSLPTFITACLTLADPKVSSDFTPQQNHVRNTLLETIIFSFSKLLPSHPAIFRSYLTQLHHLLLPLMVHSSQSSIVPREVIPAAQDLFTLLHLSSPKSNKTSTTEDYSKTFEKLLSTSHLTVSLIFRSIIEDWRPIPGNEVASISNTNLDLTSGEIDALGLPPWSGIHSGCERLRSLLSIISAFALSETSQDVSFPIAGIVDLVLRVCSVLVPPQPVTTKGFRQDLSIRINDQISQGERDGLFIELPDLHAASMDVISSICKRFGPSCKSLHDIFLEQITWVFARESFRAELKTSCYCAMTLILESSGAGLKKDTVRQCVRLLETCCDDVLSAASPPDLMTDNKNELTADTLATSFKSATNAMPSSVATTHATTTPLSLAASALLATALSRLQPTFIPSSLRAKMDRTAILAQDTRAMMASVLNQPLTVSSSKPRSSILPFLARAAPTALETEGLLRPRKPVVVQSEAYGGNEKESDDEDEMDVQQLDADMHSQGDHEEDDDATTPEATEQRQESSSIGQDSENMKKRTASTFSYLENANGDRAILTQTGDESASKKPRLAPFGTDFKQPQSQPEAIAKSIQITATTTTTSRPKDVEVAPKAPLVSVKAVVETHMADDDDDDDDIPELNMDDDSDEEIVAEEDGEDSNNIEDEP